MHVKQRTSKDTYEILLVTFVGLLLSAGHASERLEARLVFGLGSQAIIRDLTGILLA